MNANRSFSTLRQCLAVIALLFCAASPGVAAQGRRVSSGDPQDGAAAAQATMASLFGPKASLALPPRVDGTIALPGFDSKNLQVDESVTRRDNASGRKIERIQ